MDIIKKRAQKWLCIAIALMLISMVGASLVQTSGGSVTIKDLRWETTIGYQMSGLLFVPHGVSEKNKAPAIVVSHGMFNNREMQDANYVELSRRGYVVLSMDMFSHGNSENVPNIGVLTTGMYEAVKMLATLNYIDTERIGITGHSLGGMSSNAAIAQDNAAPKRLISAVLLNCADATYADAKTKEFTDVYGSRNAGIVAAQYDEFFMRDVDQNGNPTSSKDYIKYSNAQSFLHFGIDPKESDNRVADTIYRQTIDGKEAIRVIYNPPITHPWSHFSERSTSATIEFFNAALGSPNSIPAGSQVWQVKELFNLIGLIGFTMFVLCLAVLMLFTPFFSSLRSNEVVSVRDATHGGKSWFWGMLSATAAFGALTYVPVLTHVKSFTMNKDPWPQSSPYGISVWALLCGLFTILLLVLFYYLYGRKNGFNLAERGVRMPLNKIWRTVVLSIVVIAISYSCVFFADYFFKTDFRLWVLAVKAFGPDKILVSIFPYAVFFLIFYIANSVAVNSFNFIRIGSKEGKQNEWVNTAILALFNTLPIVILLLLQYIDKFSTGFLLFDNARMQIVWTFPLLVILPVTAILSRKIYRITNNPYLPGIINGIIVTLVACSNTLTWG
ncbi:prolyl oligopeptidase family protein [Anaerobacterium chartisolvens]|uniref:Prolyl oligopeptidase family protein n=1 Tax=Anaerobacterium chartisolvens TaxID=1297424 RepID=A0A369AEK8_9FIRM|nr:alpha/beta fold hydrolase [Anaerobacterium chartisolvens]RCX07535.1 prolyl oligopeptidase family protein [Anaerobacterium chartisolvens]